MGHFLDSSQLAEACMALGLNAAEDELIVAAEKAGEAIAAALGVQLLSVTNEPGLGGLCACFAPLTEGQACPDLLKPFDPSSDWADQT